MSRIRVWHSALGMLIAPSVLFFALTGALQIYSLHEAHDGYEPLPLIEKLASVHKDQVFERPERHDAEKAADEDASHKGAQPEKEKEEPRSTALLKAYFFTVALGLAVSITLGIWMGLKHARQKRLHLALLLIGTVLPAALLLA